MLWFHFLPPCNGGVGDRVHRGLESTPPNKNFNHLTKEFAMISLTEEEYQHRLVRYKRFKLARLKYSGRWEPESNGGEDLCSCCRIHPKYKDNEFLCKYCYKLSPTVYEDDFPSSKGYQVGVTEFAIINSCGV